MPDTLKPCRCGGKAELKDKCLIEHCGWGKSFLVFWFFGLNAPSAEKKQSISVKNPRKKLTHGIDVWERGEKADVH